MDGAQRWAAPRLKTPPSSPSWKGGQGMVRLSPVWTPDQRVGEHADQAHKRDKPGIGTTSPPNALEALLRRSDTEDKEQRRKKLQTLIEDDETVGAGEAVDDGPCPKAWPSDAEQWEHAMQASRNLHQKAAAQLAASVARRELRYPMPQPEPEPEPETSTTGGMSSWLGNFWSGVPAVFPARRDRPDLPTQRLEGVDDSAGTDTDSVLRNRIHAGLMENLDQHSEVVAACRMLLAAAHADSSRLRQTFDAWAAHSEWISWTEHAVARFVWESEGETIVWAWKRWMRYFETALRYHISVGRIVSSSGYGAVSWTWSVWRTWLHTCKSQRVVIQKIFARRCRLLKVMMLTRWRRCCDDMHHIQRISCRAIRRLVSIRQHGALARWRQMAIEQANLKKMCSRVLQRMFHRKLAAAFGAWQNWAQKQARLDQVVERVMLRWRRTSVAGAWGKWLDFTDECTRARTIINKVVRKVAHLQLHFSFAQWMDSCVTARRKRDMADRCLRQMKLTRIGCAYRRWCEHVDHILRLRSTLTKAVEKLRAVTLAAALCAWASRVEDQRRIGALAQRAVARLRWKVLCETLERWINAVEVSRTQRQVQVHEGAIAKGRDAVHCEDREETENELPSQSYHHHPNDQQEFPNQEKSRLQWEQEKALLVLRSLATEMRRVEEDQEARNEDARQHATLAKALAAQRNRLKAMEKRASQVPREFSAQPALAGRSMATLQYWAERGGRHGNTPVKSCAAATCQCRESLEASMPSQATTGLLAGRSVRTLERWAAAQYGRRSGPIRPQNGRR